jgi:hypothetical protein
MTNITVQLPDELLEQVQSLAGNGNLQGFLISAIEHEVERQQPSKKQAFWANLQQLPIEPIGQRKRVWAIADRQQLQTDTL